MWGREFKDKKGSELGEWPPRRVEYWVHGAEGASGLNQRVFVSTIDLRDLNSVSGQLNRMFPAEGTLQEVKFPTSVIE